MLDANHPVFAALVAARNPAPEAKLESEPEMVLPEGRPVAINPNEPATLLKLLEVWDYDDEAFPGDYFLGVVKDRGYSWTLGGPGVVLNGFHHLQRSHLPHHPICGNKQLGFSMPVHPVNPGNVCKDCLRRADEEHARGHQRPHKSSLMFHTVPRPPVSELVARPRHPWDERGWGPNQDPFY